MNSSSPSGLVDDASGVEVALQWARNQQPLVAVGILCAINITFCSVLPLPMGVWLMIIFGVLYGQMLGVALYLLTSLIGAWITFGIVRLVRHRIVEMLGPHTATWRRMDAAITREGLWLALLWRVAPIAPYVVSSAMLSMTDISQWNYLWTTALGIIPSSFPIVTGAALAGTMLIERKEVDPVTLGINVASLLAGIYVCVRLGQIAVEVIKRGDAADAEVADDAADAAAPRSPKSGSGAPAAVSVGSRMNLFSGGHGVPSPVSPAEKSARSVFDVLARNLASHAQTSVRAVQGVVEGSARGLADLGSSAAHVSTELLDRLAGSSQSLATLGSGSSLESRGRVARGAASPAGSGGSHSASSKPASQSDLRLLL